MAPPLGPPPPPKNDPAHVQRMMKKYKIRFLGPADTLSSESCPANLRTTLDQARKLGHTDYDTYTEDVRSDAAQQQPWRYQRLDRAQTLFTTAGRCLRLRKGEAGWRFDVEPLVCRRFTVEVACKTCRGRLWRSEEEVAPGSAVRMDASEGDGLPSLQARQGRRKPCQCPDTTFRRELEDRGLNPIFENHAEEAILYTEEMKRDLRRREHRPDRIIGLCQTRTIESLLEKPDRRHISPPKTVRETIRTTPFREDGEPVVFPFLVMEAKSEKSGCPFSDIDMQTAFAIRELVLLQNELQRAASGFGHAEWDAAPLVWYISYRGENWRLHAAFPRPNGDTDAVDVVRLWDGVIDSARGALQLLLLVDYICDWGRDKFRESIIRSLAALSRSNRQGTVASEILSLRAATATPAPTLRPGAMNEITDTPTRVPEAGTGLEADYRRGRYLDPDEQKKLVDLPLRQSPVRDIRVLTSRSSGVLITEENLELLRESSPSAERFSYFAKSLLLTLVVTGFKTTWDALKQAQAAWHKGGNGPYPVGPGLFGPGNTKYFAMMSFVWYLSASWEPVRELYWLAIEESVLCYLSRAARGDRWLWADTARLYFTRTYFAADIEESLGEYTDIGARLNIAACLLGASRVLVSLNVHCLMNFPLPHERLRVRTYDSFPSVDEYGDHVGAIVSQLHSDHESGRLGSCGNLAYRVSYKHIVDRIDLGDIAMKKLGQSLGGGFLVRHPFEGTVLDVGTPLLVIDPQELDPVTETPAHCTFALEEGPPRQLLSHATGSHKMYFVAERVLDGMYPQMNPMEPDYLTRKLIRTTNSDNVWLVQPPLDPAEESDMDEEESFEDTPEQPARFDTPAPMSELVSSVERSEVADWARGVKHEVIEVDGDDEGGIDYVTSGLRNIPARSASPGPAQEQSRSLPAPWLDGQELEGHNGAKEGASRPGPGARGSKRTLQVGAALTRRSKRISTGGRM